MLTREQAAIAAVLKKWGINMGHSVFQNIVHDVAVTMKVDSFAEFYEAAGYGAFAELG